MFYFCTQNLFDNYIFLSYATFLQLKKSGGQITKNIAKIIGKIKKELLTNYYIYCSNKKLI